MYDGDARYPWLPTLDPNSSAPLRLLCLPFAGGGAWIYRDWQKQLPIPVEVCPVHLPGRGPRLGEPPVDCVDALVEAMAAAIGPTLDRPFAIFGHSMGALLSFELSRRLGRDFALVPEHLFISALGAAHRTRRLREPPLHSLSDEELLAEIGDLNGTPREVLEHEELMTLLLPVLRADFKAVETYEHVAGPPLDCPITAFGGLEDEYVTRRALRAWEDQTRDRFLMRMLPGGHFFVNTARDLVLRAIARDLAPLVTVAA